MIFVFQALIGRVGLARRSEYRKTKVAGCTGEIQSRRTVVCCYPLPTAGEIAIAKIVASSSRVTVFLLIVLNPREMPSWAKPQRSWPVQAHRAKAQGRLRCSLGLTFLLLQSWMGLRFEVQPISIVDKSIQEPL
jgi:hypothetical protein